LAGGVGNEEQRPVIGPGDTSEVSESLRSDIAAYFVNRPSIPTLIDFASDEVREDYSHRIAQRVGIDVSQYSVLNIHRIGIEAPVRYVFDEIVSWDGDAPYWPNHVATLDRVGPRPEHVRVVLFGKSIGAWLSRVSGGRLGTLFKMCLRILRAVPGESDVDNARYILWDCSGGYPIGIFAVFARSPLPALQEEEKTQLFFAVGFNPHGISSLARIRPVRKTWEAVHNRVTGNVLNRFKRLCESGFVEARDGLEVAVPPDHAVS
jgi:hypothetical protein